MKLNNNTLSSALPDIQVAISYDVLYGDYDKVNPFTFIKGIPTIAILNFVVELQNKVLYALSDTPTQKQMIKEMCPWLNDKVRYKAWQFQKKHKMPLLMSSESSFLMFRLTLSNYVPFESGDEELDLCQDEMEGVYKAILYCNQIWTDHQSHINNIHRIARDSMSLAKFSVSLDLPIVEFKFYKDFRTQLYKAVQFFKFCENDPTFSTYLPYFYKDCKVLNWKEYLLQLFNFFYASLKNKYISLDDHRNPLPTSLHDFFGQFTIDTNDKYLKNLWDDNQGMKYIRDHFLLRVSDKIYLLLNANLLVDKIYQGMMFDFWKCVKNNQLLTNGKQYTDYKHFSSIVGENFSEPKMLYPLLHKCFDNKVDVMHEGNFFRAKGMKGEPDFYMREGNSLFLFEHKDSTLGDPIKFSKDVEYIKQQVLERICYDGIDSSGKYKRKGGGQLLFTINELLNNHIFDQYDHNITNIQYIFPIIVTTDSAFSSLGISALVIEAFNNIIKERDYKFGAVSVYDPVVVDIDTLIKLCYLLSAKKINLKEVMLNYLSTNTTKICPFSTFVRDNVLKNHIISEEENKFLFDELFEDS